MKLLFLAILSALLVIPASAEQTATAELARIDKQIEELRSIRREMEKLEADPEEIAKVSEATGVLLATRQTWQERSNYEKIFHESVEVVRKKHPASNDPQSEFTRLLEDAIGKATQDNDPILDDPKHVIILADRVAASLKGDKYTVDEAMADAASGRAGINPVLQTAARGGDRRAQLQALATQELQQLAKEQAEKGISGPAAEAARLRVEQAALQRLARFEAEQALLEHQRSQARIQGQLQRLEREQTKQRHERDLRTK